MISLYFGLPRCGKTTTLAKLAHDAVRQGRSVYSNVPLKIEGVTFIENGDIGRYDMSGGLILIDEATIYADSRQFAKFPPDVVEFFVLHGHWKCDICLFCQIYNRTDSTIRMLAERVFYCKRGKILPITRIYRVPYGIAFTPPAEGTGSKYGDINEGYAEPNILQKIFCTRVWRPLYYKYFDSWEHKDLPPLSSKLSAKTGRNNSRS